MKSKRILAVLLSVLLLAGMLPGSVWAQLSADGAAPAEVRTDESSVGEALPEDAAEETALPDGGPEETAPPDGAQEETAPPDVTADGAALKAAVEGDYTYDVSDGNATITKYTGTGGDVTIPSTLGGYPVTTIGEFAFQNTYSLTSVVIPEGVTSIEANVFLSCTGIKSVTLPKGLKSVGSTAFANCEFLEEVHISDVAAWCAVSFENTHSNPLAIGSTFDKLYVNGELVHELVIPEGVELDGAMLADGTDYTAKAGSTVVTLKAETLEKLSVGAHTLSILFDDGEAELTLTVKEKPVSPKTGDGAQLLFWLAVTAADVLALGAIALLRRKKTRA